ncbi:MAG TPA: hypothetical protein VK154_04260 [Chitinophagales bacterium]|nr:hypothetical protein [Chitinophagales bacterium]
MKTPEYCSYIHYKKNYPHYENSSTFGFYPLALVSIYSCECRITCGEKNYNTHFVSIGFSDTDLTPLILKTYIANSNFAQVKDSFTINEFPDNGWTDEGLYNGFFFSNQPDLDYTIELPTVGRSFQVNNFVFEKEECKMCGRKYVINTLKGYIINGEVKSTDGRVEIRE